MRSDLLSDFKSYLEREVDLDVATIQRYYRCVETWLTEAGGTRGLTDDFLLTKLGAVAAPSTRNVWASSFRAYADFLESRDKRVPFRRATIRLRKIPKRLPRPLKRATLTQLCEVLEQRAGTDVWAAQDWLCVETLYGSGLRVEECATLPLGAFESPEVLRVIGKRNKERRTMVTGPQWRALRQYAALRFGACTDAEFEHLRREGTLPLFYSSDGRPFAALVKPGKGLWTRVTTAFGLVNLVATPHQIRHSFATHLLEGGARLEEVQEMMGHEDPKTTMQYTALAESRFNRVAQFHPRA